MSLLGCTKFLIIKPTFLITPLLRHDHLIVSVQRSAGRVHDDTELALSELQRSVERLQELLEDLLDQAGLEKMEQAQEVADSLEAEIKVLKKRDTEMKDLAGCQDHIYYLQVRWTREGRRGVRTKGIVGSIPLAVEVLDSETAIFFRQTCESMCTPMETGDLPPVLVNPDASFEPVRDVILDLREKVEDLCNQELSKITKQGLSQVSFYLPRFNILSFFHRAVFSLPVNDTTMFTLGDGKFQTF